MEQQFNDECRMMNKKTRTRDKILFFGFAFELTFCILRSNF